ncbi:MAG: hypothetical protein AAFX03_03390 [Pseudomonadota bacterium]
MTNDDFDRELQDLFAQDAAALQKDEAFTGAVMGRIRRGGLARRALLGAAAAVGLAVGLAEAPNILAGLAVDADIPDFELGAVGDSARAWFDDPPLWTFALSAGVLSIFAAASLERV